MLTFFLPAFLSPHFSGQRWVDPELVLTGPQGKVTVIANAEPGP